MWITSLYGHGANWPKFMGVGLKPYSWVTGVGFPNALQMADGWMLHMWQVDALRLIKLSIQLWLNILIFGCFKLDSRVCFMLYWC